MTERKRQVEASPGASALLTSECTIVWRRMDWPEEAPPPDILEVTTAYIQTFAEQALDLAHYTDKANLLPTRTSSPECRCASGLVFRKSEILRHLMRYRQPPD